MNGLRDRARTQEPHTETRNGRRGHADCPVLHEADDQVPVRGRSPPATVRGAFIGNPFYELVTAIRDHWGGGRKCLIRNLFQRTITSIEPEQ